MKNRHWIFSGFILIIATLIYSFYSYTIFNSRNVEIRIQVFGDTDQSTFDFYYSTTSNFSESQKIKLNKASNNWYDGKIKLDGLEKLNKIRLDFPKKEKFQISSLIMATGSKEWVYNANQLTEGLIKGSNGITNLSLKDGLVYIETGTNDPYLLFNKIYTDINWDVVLKILPLVFLFPLISFFYGNRKNLSVDLILLILFLFTLPLKNSFTSFISILIITTGLFEVVRNKSFKELNTIMFLPILFLIPALFGILKGTSMNYGIYIGAALFMFFLFQLNFDQNKIEILKKMYFNLSISFSFVFISIFIYLIGLEIISWSLFLNDPKIIYPILSLYFPYAHPTFLAFFISLGLFFGSKSKYYDSVGKIIISIFLLVSSSRLAIFLLMVYIILEIMRRINAKRIHYFLMCLFSIISLYIVVFYFDQQRNLLWTYYSDQLNILNFYDFINLNSNSPKPLETHSHNQYIWFWYNYGLLPFLFLVAYSVYFLYDAIKSMEQIRIFIAIVFIGLLSVESPFNTNKPSLLLGFIITLFMIIDTQNRTMGPKGKQIEFKK